MGGRKRVRARCVRMPKASMQWVHLSIYSFPLFLPLFRKFYYRSTSTGKKPGQLACLMSPDIFALPVTRMPCTWQAGCCVYRPYDHPRRHQPPRLNRRRHLPPRSSRIRHTHLPLPSRCGRRRRSHMAQRAQRFSSCCKPILMRRCLPSSSSQRTARQTASRCTNGRWQRSARRDFFRSCSKSLRKRAG